MMRLPGLAPPEVVEDRPCEECGYNVRALPLRSKCPECGTPIMGKTASAFDPLCAMPRPVIRRFRTSSVLAAACIVALVVTQLLDATVGLPQIGWIRLGLVVVWIFAAFGLTPVMDVAGARAQGFTEGNTLRRAARWSQLVWLIVWTPGGLGRLLPGVWFGLNANGILALTGGAAAITLLAAWLMRFADWTRDAGAHGLLNGAAWCLPVGVVGFLLGGAVHWVIAMLAVALTIASLVMFGIGVLGIAASIARSIRHARERVARDARRRERAERLGEQLVSTIDRMDAARDGRGGMG